MATSSHSQSHSQYPRSPNLSTRSYDSSSVSSATSPKSTPVGPVPYLSGLMSANSANSARPNAAAPPQPIGIPPPLPPPGVHTANTASFQPYTPVTASSVMGRDSMPSNESVASMASTPGQPSHQQNHQQPQLNHPTPSNPTIPTPSGLQSQSQSQKRAYRQRRKDPSCDACRERKVKCDATETTSCSECSSRNVKCQFTKETNRRMSSIKQVQDLEKQMDKVRRENGSLRRMLSERDGQLDMDVDGMEQLPLQLPDLTTDPKRRKRPPPLQDLPPHTQSTLRTVSAGIWKAPAPYRQPAVSSLFSPPRPELPPMQVTEPLLNSYYSSFHTMMPILHWPTFRIGVDDAYKTIGPTSTPTPVLIPQPPFMAMLFAVLAVGSLCSNEPHSYRSGRATEFMEASRRFVDPWNNDPDLDAVRCLVLTTVFLNEMNLKTAASSSLGSAVRVAQDMALHCEVGPLPMIESEMRRRVWWAIYVLDRSLSLDMGRPSSIDDSDCDVSLPAAVDDHFILDTGVLVPNGSEPLTHSFLAIINVIRTYPALIKALGTPVVAPTRLATFDQHFATCLRTFPQACDPSGNVPLSAHFLAPLTYLLHARLVLHRHNLMPTCPPDVRLAAIDQCAHTALETASLLSRLNSPITEGATALVTTHIFRCTLFLLLAGYLDQAGICVRVLGQLTSSRDVAQPCGRFVAFFVQALATKRADIAAHLAHNTPPPPPQQPFAPPPPPNARPNVQDALFRDEELLIFVSTDLQANPDTAWAWLGPAPPLVEKLTSVKSPVSAGVAPSSSLLVQEYRMGITEGESQEWGGWELLESRIRGLAMGSTPLAGGPLAPMKVEHGTTTLPPLAGPSGSVSMSATPPGSLPGLSTVSAPTPTLGMAPASSHNSPVSAGPSQAPQTKTKSQERISIANII